MKIKIGIWKDTRNKYKLVDKNMEIVSYEVKIFNRQGFKTRLMKHLKKVNKIINNIKDTDVFIVAVDLIYNRKKYLGGCAISGATINATRVSILDMACTQLIRQIKKTLKELK